MKQALCYGCVNLRSVPDAAGGGTYFCWKTPGLVVGEWGHWTTEDDKPRVISDCYVEATLKEAKHEGD